MKSVSRSSSCGSEPTVMDPNDVSLRRTYPSAENLVACLLAALRHLKRCAPSVAVAVAVAAIASSRAGGRWWWSMVWLGPPRCHSARWASAGVLDCGGVDAAF